MAVGAWIADNKSDELTPIMYVLSDLANSEGWYTSETIPDLRGTRHVWGDRLTEASQTALDDTLGVVADLQTVDVRESVVDEDAFGHLGCYPYVAGRAMLRLQRPLAIGDLYFMEANVDQGCEGLALLLRVEARGIRFEVTEVVRDGHWIV